MDHRRMSTGELLVALHGDTHGRGTPIHPLNFPLNCGIITPWRLRTGKPATYGNTDTAEPWKRAGLFLPARAEAEVGDTR